MTTQENPVQYMNLEELKANLSPNEKAIFGSIEFLPENLLWPIKEFNADVRALITPEKLAILGNEEKARI